MHQPKAKLVWDGDIVRVPEEMGAARADQLQGTYLEQLSEVACRICYDSLGSGRSSVDLHKHILDVKHTSVYEHPTITIELIGCYDKFWRNFTNRPGFWLELSANNLQITYNLRAALEWDRHTTHTNDNSYTKHLGEVLHYYANEFAPQVFTTAPIHITPQTARAPHRFVPPHEHNQHQAWISLYMSGSRGFSHEQVRHGNETAISQRSTRYVDESDSPYIRHPLLQQYIETEPDGKELELLFLASENSTKASYREIVNRLQAFVTNRGAPKTYARKQARGAARGILANALQTEMIFSASAAQWRWMLLQRCSAPADAEIRAIYVSVLHALKSSRYAHFFEDMRLVQSPDGIGEILA